MEDALIQVTVSILHDLVTRITRRRAAPPEGLHVRAIRSLDAVAPLADRLEALNLASRRPTPFDTLAYLRTFLAHDEYRVPGQEVLFLVALEGGSPVGYLPLRRVPERVLGIPYTALRCLMVHDNERPRVVSRPEDEARCSAAFYRYLVEEERGWDFLQLHEQDADSALRTPPPSLDLRRFHVRRLPTNPNATILLPYRSVDDYLHALHKNHRRKLAQTARRLLQAGTPELVTAIDPRSLPGALDLYLDLERRSWKVHVGGHIGRHPERVAFFRRLVGPDQPLAMIIHLLLLDGVPIAGALGGSFGRDLYWYEEAFDDGYRDLAPGNAMMLLLVRDAIERGFRSLDLFGNYAYYKARWGATITETEAVQLYRIGSLIHLKALAGDVRRWLRPPVTQRDVDFNLEKRAAAGEDAAGDAPPKGAHTKDTHENDTHEKGTHERGTHEKGAHGKGTHEKDTHEGGARTLPERAEVRERAQAALRALEDAGAPLDRLSNEALRRALTFETGRGKAHAAGRSEAA